MSKFSIHPTPTYGINVETAGDHPAWHKSDTDVFPGKHDGGGTP